MSYYYSIFNMLNIKKNQCAGQYMNSYTGGKYPLRMMSYSEPKTLDYVYLVYYNEVVDTNYQTFPQATCIDKNRSYLLRYYGTLNLLNEEVFLYFNEDSDESRFTLRTAAEIRQHQADWTVLQFGEQAIIGINSLYANMVTYTNGGNIQRQNEALFVFTTPWEPYGNFGGFQPGQPNWYGSDYICRGLVTAADEPDPCANCSPSQQCEVVEGQRQCTYIRPCGECKRGYQCVVQPDGQFNCEYLPSEEEVKLTRTLRITGLILLILIVFLIILLIAIPLSRKKKFDSERI